jgi:hypothetical protein
VENALESNIVDVELKNGADLPAPDSVNEPILFRTQEWALTSKPSPWKATI